MVGFRYLTVISMVMILAFMIPAVSGGEVKDSEDIDIDHYVTIEMIFDEGETFDIEATITSTRDHISVYLFKGEQDYQGFVDTEEIDIEAIKAGDNTTYSNSSFRVVRDFSKENVTSFHESLSIGEKDTYYLVIAIHRESGMSKEAVLGLGTRVNYEVSHEEMEKEVPYYLIPIAILLGLIGIGLIVLYYRMGKKEEGSEEEEPLPERGHPRDRLERGRRSPPSRFDRR